MLKKVKTKNILMGVSQKYVGLNKTYVCYCYLTKMQIKLNQLIL